MDAVMQLASDRPAVYESIRQGILRAPSGELHLHDAVAKIRADGIEIGNVVEDLKTGSYLLELCPADTLQQINCPDESKPITYRWDTKQPRLYPLPGIRGGLYRLYLCDDTTGIALRTSNYADILGASDNQYAAWAERFAEVVRVTRAMEATDPTIVVLRRVYLHSIAIR
jgi:hypothetical protein